MVIILQMDPLGARGRPSQHFSNTFGPEKLRLGPRFSKVFVESSPQQSNVDSGVWSTGPQVWTLSQEPQEDAFFLGVLAGDCPKVIKSHPGTFSTQARIQLKYATFFPFHAAARTKVADAAWGEAIPVRVPMFFPQLIPKSWRLSTGFQWSDIPQICGI